MDFNDCVEFKSDGTIVPKPPPAGLSFDERKRWKRRVSQRIKRNTPGLRKRGEHIPGVQPISQQSNMPPISQPPPLVPIFQPVVQLPPLMHSMMLPIEQELGKLISSAVEENNLFQVKKKGILNNFVVWVSTRYIFIGHD